MGISFNAAQLLSGNGIDVNGVVDQIQAQKSGQVKVWQQEQTDLQTQASLLGTLNTDLNNLQTAMNALKDPLGALTAVAANSSLPAILTATADTTAAAANHTIVVTLLASAGTVYTGAVAGGADVSILPNGATGGDLQLQIGGGTPKDIAITAGSNDTVNKLATYINQQSTKNNWGVTASVLTDATGARLAITSSATGTPGALAITGNIATGMLNTVPMSGADSSILTDGGQPGDLKLQIGGSGGTTVDIPITAGSNDTLNTLAQYITIESTANHWGVSASVVSDGGGNYHLAIASTAKGPAGALAFTTNTNTNLTAAATPATNLSFTAVGGANATLTIDGIGFSSTTNNVSGAIPGVTLNLISAEPTVPLQLSVGPDSARATTAINAFVVAYNTLITAINHQFALDPTTSQEGPLGSDGALRSLQSRLLADVSYSPASNGLVNLRSLGIKTNSDGTLAVGQTVDNKSLTDVMTANPSAFLDFFQNSSTGFAHNFGADLSNMTSPVDGVLNVDIAQNGTQQNNLTDQINNFNDRLAAQRLQLIAQFSRVNAALETYPSLLAELNAALGNAVAPTSTNTTPTAGRSTSSSSNG